MVKIFIVTIGIGLIAVANPPQRVQTNCLNCHIEQKIPSELIYRRYLMKYSTNTQIKKKILKYLKNPKEELSIMPKQFFLKFLMKEKLSIDDKILEDSVNEYIEYFDITKRLKIK